MADFPLVYLNVNSNGRGALYVDGVDLSAITVIHEVSGGPNSSHPPIIRLSLYVPNGTITKDGKLLYTSDVPSVPDEPPQPPATG